MELEDELRRLLHDEQLDIPIRTGAEWSLVAGARRRRQRNRTLAFSGAALAFVLLAGGGLMLAGQQPVGPFLPPVPVVQPAQPPASKVPPRTFSPSTSPHPSRPQNYQEPTLSPQEPTDSRSTLPPTILNSPQPPTETTSSPDPSTTSQPPTTSARPETTPPGGAG